MWAWQLILGKPEEAVAMLAILTWFLPWMYCLYKVTEFRCPRCGCRFFQRLWWLRANVFRRSCAHCGLPKYANPWKDRRREHDPAG